MTWLFHSLSWHQELGLLGLAQCPPARFVAWLAPLMIVWGTLLLLPGTSPPHSIWGQTIWEHLLSHTPLENNKLAQDLRRSYNMKLTSCRFFVHWSATQIAAEFMDHLAAGIDTIDQKKASVDMMAGKDPASFSNHSHRGSTTRFASSSSFWGKTTEHDDLAHGRSQLVRHRTGSSSSYGKSHDNIGDTRDPKEMFQPQPLTEPQRSLSVVDKASLITAIYQLKLFPANIFQSSLPSIYWV
jgi:hypothetical protein